MSERPHIIAGVYCMCQRMRQPLRADTCSILCQSLLMVAMVYLVSRRAWSRRRRSGSFV
jgi:hypothetical protein